MSLIPRKSCDRSSFVFVASEDVAPISCDTTRPTNPSVVHSSTLYRVPLSGKRSSFVSLASWARFDLSFHSSRIGTRTDVTAEWRTLSRRSCIIYTTRRRREKASGCRSFHPACWSPSTRPTEHHHQPSSSTNYYYRISFAISPSPSTTRRRSTPSNHPPTVYPCHTRKSRCCT
jgi:hypothetical protein